MKSYPFCKCLNPRSIRNPYTKEPLVVSCGICEACLNAKTNQMSLKCELESMSSKYCYFVTLTYANNYIPLAQLHKDNKENLYYLVDITERWRYKHNIDILETLSYGEILSEVTLTDKEAKDLQNKCHMNGFIPFLYKPDAQNFVKRLRKYIYETSKEKIRYYCCGEYGSVHFRPHFHFLLYFDRQETAENLRSNICKAWRFGRIDVSQSRGQCSNYVASYVNSYTSIPRILKAKSVAPFQLHSTFFGEKILRSKRKEVYESTASDFNKRSISINGMYKEFSPWRSFKHFYYPKCRNYDFLSHEQRYKSYTYYNCFSHRERVFKPSELAKIVLEDLNIPYGKSKHIYIYEQCSLSDYFRPLPSITYEQAYLRVYSFLRISKHFCTFVSANCIKMFDYYVRKIEQYYKDSDLDNLHSQLSREVEYSEEYACTCEEDYYNFFANKFDYSKLIKTKVYEDFSFKQKELSEKKVKHKKLNDLNKIFFN